MNPKNFIITEFSNIYEANNVKGKILELEKRYCSCFIITLYGSIRFSYDGGSVVADSCHPVFIPEGLSYQNECLEDAKSLVFNFHVLNKYNAPMILSSVPHGVATEKYNEIEKALLHSTAENKMTVLCELYSLASRLFSEPEKTTSGNITINRATEYIRLNYSHRDLSVAQVARECFVSEIYLRKLFIKNLAITPFNYITKVRMKHAYNLAREKLPVKEIAGLVGYADIYQFSRAYKKYFGYPPSETM